MRKKVLLLLIVLSIIVVSVSLFLNISVLYSENNAFHAPTNEELNIIYSEIIQNNKEKLESSVQQYGNEFCSMYVSTEMDLNLHKKILNEVKVLSDTICSNADNDYDKIKRIAYWVAENIYYNEIAAQDSVTSDVISLETILETHTTTCAGYSNMFSALCNMQGIYCINLRGGTMPKNCYTADGLDAVPLNHEWNAVIINDNWHFIDVTWLSNNIYNENGYIKSDTFDDIYFDTSFEEMSYEHRIDLADYRDFNSSIDSFN